jgi:hypothetical protein
MLPIGLEITRDPETAIRMLEAHIAMAHGYASLLRNGFFVVAYR